LVYICFQEYGYIFFKQIGIQIDGSVVDNLPLQNDRIVHEKGEYVYGKIKDLSIFEAPNHLPAVDNLSILFFWLRDTY
jgi:hypothetical protein